MERLSPNLIRLELPSHTLPPHTHTNSYLIHDAGVAMLVDPGFHEAESLRLIQDVLGQNQIRFLKAVLLTHSHQDHVLGLAMLQEAFADLPVYIHPNEVSRLEAYTNVKVLNDDRKLTIGDKVVQALFTPGHSPGHLSYYLPEAKAALVGDLIAGQGSTWIGLPEGDVDDYLTSIDRLRSLKLTLLGPGHGEISKEPYNKLNEARQHRLERLEQVIQALAEKPLELAELRASIYPGIHPHLERFSDYSLLALLKKLISDKRVIQIRDEQGPYALAPPKSA